MTGKPPRDEWDELVDASGAPDTTGISPEIARRVLDMNPRMRDEGKDTAWLVNESQANKLKGGAQPGKAAPPGNKPARPSESVVATVGALKAQMADAEKRHAKEVAEAQARLAQTKAQTLDALVSWLKQNDPELRSPFTQQVLEEDKAFFDKLGFSLKRYVELARAKK